MTRRFIISAFVLLSTLAAYGQPTADAVAQRAIDVLAGPAWNDARYFSFAFNVERDGQILASWNQQWDRFTGDYAVRGRNRDGEDVRVVMNVNTKQGRAWKNGEAAADPAELLKFGYGRFINDTYWLLMGFKSFDPGVRRAYDGEKTNACGAVHDVVRFSFQDVGLTPGDVYWMWVNRRTGLVDEWHMKLEGSKPEDPPSVVSFQDYRRFGGLLISTRREILGRKQFILLEGITVSKDVPASAFQ